MSTRFAPGVEAFALVPGRRRGRGVAAASACVRARAWRAVGTRTWCASTRCPWPGRRRGAAMEQWPHRAAATSHSASSSGRDTWSSHRAGVGAVLGHRAGLVHSLHPANIIAAYASTTYRLRLRRAALPRPRSPGLRAAARACRSCAGGRRREATPRPERHRVSSTRSSWRAPSGASGQRSLLARATLFEWTGRCPLRRAPLSPQLRRILNGHSLRASARRRRTPRLWLRCVDAWSLRRGRAAASAEWWPRLQRARQVPCARAAPGRRRTFRGGPFRARRPRRVVGGAPTCGRDRGAARPRMVALVALGRGRAPGRAGVLPALADGALAPGARLGHCCGRAARIEAP